MVQYGITVYHLRRSQDKVMGFAQISLETWGMSRHVLRGYLKPELPALLRGKYSPIGASGPYERLKLQGFHKIFPLGLQVQGKQAFSSI